LATLLWHKFAKFREHKGRPSYKIYLVEINRILQYPRYLYHIAEITWPHGQSGAAMIERFLLRGQMQGRVRKNILIFWSKIEILFKNKNFVQKYKFWSKIKKVGQKLKFWIKNRNFGQKSKFWSKIEIVVKN